jgi:hypothetical protein
MKTQFVKIFCKDIRDGLDCLPLLGGGVNVVDTISYKPMETALVDVCEPPYIRTVKR